MTTRLGLVAGEEFLRHDTGGHVEGRRRLEAIAAELARSGVGARCVPVASRAATDDELLLVHTRAHVDLVRDVAAAGGGMLDPDTVVSPDSERVARHAVGGALELVRLVLAGELDRGFAAIRPPGHHATPTRAMGFCLYSNIAIAARYALRSGCGRVAIFDPDVHHGNGTQDALDTEPACYFVSFHQSPFYPGTGRLEERGVGTTLNLPLTAGQGDAEYLWAFDRLVEPVLRAFDPELILVSCGYDAHRADPLGGMNVTTEGFRQLALRVARLSRRGSARGRVVGLLEGGYDPQRLAESVRVTLEAWLDEGDPEPVDEGRVSSACRRQVDRALALANS